MTPVKTLTVLIVMFSMCAQCRAYEDKRSLEDLLAIWFDKLSWSEGEEGPPLSPDCQIKDYFR